MLISHTRDNVVVLGEEIVKLEDIISVIPSYSLPEDCDHYSFDGSNIVLYKMVGESEEVKQYGATQNHSALMAQLETNFAAIVAARDARIVAEEAEAAQPDPEPEQ